MCRLEPRLAHQLPQCIGQPLNREPTPSGPDEKRITWAKVAAAVLGTPHLEVCSQLASE
jgi:hypothetical protein